VRAQLIWQQLWDSTSLPDVGPRARESTILQVIEENAYIFGGYGAGSAEIYSDTWKVYLTIIY